MNYADYKLHDVANGPGVRVSLFVSGCPHHCKGCFNPETWDFGYGEFFSSAVADNLMDLCDHDYIQGLSILGGEPLAPANQTPVTILCNLFKSRYPNKDLWVYTGYDFDAVKNLYAMQFVDVLVDGRFDERRKDPRLRFRGSANQRIIDVQRSLESGETILWEDLHEDRSSEKQDL